MKHDALRMQATAVDDVGPDGRWFAAACKALGHPARLAIVEHLAREGRCICGAIVEVLPLAQSTVSQHLRALKTAGFVRGEVDGPRSCYCLDHEVLARFRSLAARLAVPGGNETVAGCREEET